MVPLHRTPLHGTPFHGLPSMAPPFTEPPSQHPFHGTTFTELPIWHPPPPRGQTNITFPQLRLRAVINPNADFAEVFPSHPGFSSISFVPLTYLGVRYTFTDRVILLRNLLKYGNFLHMEAFRVDIKKNEGRGRCGKCSCVTNVNLVLIQLHEASRRKISIKVLISMKC